MSRSLSSSSAYPPVGAASSWRGAGSGELLDPRLLYLGPRVRARLERSQASADLEKFQREYDATLSGFAREMSAPFFEGDPGANFNGAVAFVGCKAGQVPHRSMPLNSLIQLVALERFGRAHPEVAPFALVGLETANRGLVKSQLYEMLCRFAFKVSRFVEQHPTLFARVTPVLDCEVMYASADAAALSRKRKDLDIWDPDRVATAVRALALSTSGVQLKVGASNFGSRREIENAKRFASRDQMHLFVGQTIAEDEQLKGEMAMLYAAGPASRRMGQLTLNPDEIQNAAWLQVDHLAVSEAEFRTAWQEHDQIDHLYRTISELDPALSIVDESLAWTLDCSRRMLDFHDLQLYEISTNKTPVTARSLENLKRDYSRAMRTYLRDLAARNFDWLLTISKQLGFQVEAPSQSTRNADGLTSSLARESTAERSDTAGRISSSQLPKTRSSSSGKLVAA